MVTVPVTDGVKGDGFNINEGRKIPEGIKLSVFLEWENNKQ